MATGHTAYGIAIIPPLPHKKMPTPDALKVSVVVPVFNEQDTLAQVVGRVLHVPNILEILIVDDGSNDNTPKVIRQLVETHSSVKALRLERNMGKTAALKAGFAATQGDIVIVQDADLEYDPNEMEDVFRPIQEGRADVVYGSRFLVRRAARVVYFYHYLANKLLTFCSNLLTNLNMTDVETGYKAFRGDIIRNMIIRSRGFGFEIEVTAKIAKLKCAVYEVPISYYGRTYEEGKKISWIDGVHALFYIFRYNIFSTLSASYRKLPDLRR